MSRNGFVVLALLTFAVGACYAEQGRQPLEFDTAQLSGVWAESYSTDPVCSASSAHSRFEFSPDKTHVTIVLDKEVETSLPGRKDRFEAEILSSTRHTLTIRYLNETRKGPSGDPVAWELAVVAPGVYRWRVTIAPQKAVNVVVGIKCRES